MVSEEAVLRYYDYNKPLSLCDASEKNLKAALLQEGQPLAHTSEALTDTEIRYTQIKKELLTVVYA